MSSALGVLASLVASSSLDLSSPPWFSFSLCAVVGRRLGSRASGKRCPRELRDANPGRSEQEGQGCWPLGCSCSIKRGTQTAEQLGWSLASLGISCPNGLPQMPSWPGHPHKCLQTHQLGSWRISPSRRMIRILPHSRRQECPCRHDPQPSLDGHVSLFPDTVHGPALASLLRMLLDICLGRALWNAFAFLAEEPNLWAKA